ncbi:MAG: methionine--tRNA ligase [Planctomycetaceae bacterium]|nr:methionine--tRNA ligase [Planctomycetaceae bacterium]
MKKLLVTSALPYANGPIHLGHLVEYIQTDIWVRYWRLRARDAIYLCADDTHGTPIMIRARDEGIQPEELIERSHKSHREDFDRFYIQFDNYYSTHSEENRELSSEIYNQLKAGGHIAERNIEQAYCVQCGMFLPDRYIRGECPKCGAEDQYGDSCEICMATYTSRDLVEPFCAECAMSPEWRESKHLFFKLGDFQDRLKDWLDAGHTQEEIANKLREWFEDGLKDWDISRDAPYFGFEIPGEENKYFYVWLDAPVGYMASTADWCNRNGANFDDYWRSDDSEVYHFIGKDITYFHALFWPAMLMGSGFRTPTQLCVHGFLTVDGAKMSKSRGTFVNAATYLEHLDPQYLRYYYATKLNSRVEDIDLSFDDFVSRVDSDLVNKLANIPSRVLSIVHKRCGGELAAMDETGRALFDQVRSQADNVGEQYAAREFAQVTRSLNEMAADINTYLNDHIPWTVAKEDPAAANIVLTSALNAFKVVATLLKPILPEFSQKVADMLRLDDLAWDDLDTVLENCPVNKYDRLADRVDRKKIDAMVEATRESFSQAEDVAAPVLTTDALVDCAFETMLLASTEPLTDTDKLSKLTVTAQDGPRQVIAGLGHDVAERGVVGKNLLVLANLEPKKLRGHESQGMILAGTVDDVPIPVQVPDPQTRCHVE